MTINRGKRLLICTAEASGERLASQLIPRLRSEYPGVQIWALGGAGLRALDVFNVYDTAGVGAVGLLEALPKAYAVKKMTDAYKYSLKRWSPDLVLTVDSPSLMLPLCRLARSAGVPACHWVGPQVWAWRASRVPRVAKAADRILCLFPHEPRAFIEAGGDACWVGHPATMDYALADPPPDTLTGPRFGLAPGSRDAEVRRLWPVFCETAKALRMIEPDAQFVVACAPGQERGRFSGIPGIQIGTSEDLRNTHAVLACSGTITLELALAGVPTVAAYKLSRITYAVARRLVSGVEYISLPNILLGEPLVVEHIQDLSPTRLASDLLLSAARRSDFQRGSADLRRLLDNGDPIKNTSRALAPWLKEGATECR